MRNGIFFFFFSSSTPTIPDLLYFSRTNPRFRISMLRSVHMKVRVHLFVLSHSRTRPDFEFQKFSRTSRSWAAVIWWNNKTRRQLIIARTTHLCANSSNANTAFEQRTSPAVIQKWQRSQSYRNCKQSLKRSKIVIGSRLPPWNLLDTVVLGSTSERC